MQGSALDSSFVFPAKHQTFFAATVTLLRSLVGCERSSIETAHIGMWLCALPCPGQRLCQCALQIPASRQNTANIAPRRQNEEDAKSLSPLLLMLVSVLVRLRAAVREVYVWTTSLFEIHIRACSSSWSPLIVPLIVSQTPPLRPQDPFPSPSPSLLKTKPPFTSPIRGTLTTIFISTKPLPLRAPQK